jgi:hypothetical protein
MISQIVRNESVRFGRHIDIEVSYKLLQLEIPKLVQIFHYLACFQKGLFGSNSEQKHPPPFRGKNLGILNNPKQRGMYYYILNLVGNHFHQLFNTISCSCSM